MPSKELKADLNAFHEYWDRFEKPRGSLLCYNTARCIREYEKLPKLYPCFRAPDILITGDGTEIRWAVIKNRFWTEGAISSHGHADAAFGRDSEWDSCIRNCWDKSAENVKKALDALDEHCIPHLNDTANALNGVGEARYAITLKGGDNVFKRSHACMRRLEEELNTGEKIVELSTYPAWGDTPVPQIISALPSNSGKGRAANYIAKTLGFDDCDCVGAGDTLGDASMVFHTSMPFLAVGNATESLKDVVRNRGKSSDKEYLPFSLVVKGFGVAGVLEGVKEFRNFRGDVINSQ